MEEIKAADDARIAKFHLHRDEPFRSHNEVIVDSERVIHRFLHHGLRLISALGSPEFLANLVQQFPETKHAKLYSAAPGILNDIVGFRFHQGGVGIFARPADCALAELGKRVIVLDQLNNGENVGAMIRSAHALGFSGVLLSPESCSPRLRRSVRVSMGSVLKVKIRHSQDFAEDLSSLKTSGFALVGLAVDETAVPLKSLASSLSPLALVVGAEDRGISATSRKLCHQLAQIPMAPGCDSLNATVALSIACYHFLSLPNEI